MIEPWPSPESTLLLTLEEISQLVSHSHDPRETLDNIVALIQGRFHTDVCSVYLLEPDRAELVLGASLGLKPESVGHVRMRLDEGLTGLVAERMAPVMVGDAFAHPRFKYFPEAGEDLYHSFLGIPLVEGGMLQGVLVVQTREPRVFSPNETRMLVTVGSQLAPLVSEAHLLERVAAAAHDEAPLGPAGPAAEPLCWQGSALSGGKGWGQAYVLAGIDRQPAAHDGASDPAGERSRLAQALAAAREEVTRLSQRISVLVGEEHGAILQAQLLILQDRTIEHDLEVCLQSGQTCEEALHHTLEKYVAAFHKLASPYLQERVYDVKDVFRRILWHLRPPSATADVGGGRLVLVGHEASVMDLFSVDLDRLAAVVVEHGGPQSHAAILARSLGIPMVGQVHDLAARVPPGRPLLVDGDAGTVYLDPPAELIAHCRLPVAKEAANGSAAADASPATDQRGLPRLEVNINLLCEAGPAVEQRAGGVGLFRSEFLFLARRTLPTEEEQVGIYRKLLRKLEGRPVTIRTFDLRPDKLAHFSAPHSAPPPAPGGGWGRGAHPLDWRLVLDSPPIQQLFKDQVRAILRAAASGPARILVPLVTRGEHLDFVLATVAQAREELRREGLEFGNPVPLGVMIEVAAATQMVDAWAPQVDFFALGTNDLIASCLGIDRDDPVGATVGDPLHPGVLRLLGDVVRAAHAAGRPVTVCGEMAAEPRGIRALTTLGVDALSVPVNQLGAVRRILAEMGEGSAQGLASQLPRPCSEDRARQLVRA